MIKRFIGVSPLAALAERLPPRARTGIALLAAELALPRLKSSPDFPIARKAFELARRWYDGERFNPDQFEDVLVHEYDRDLYKSAIQARSALEDSAWLAIQSALAYIALYAYRELGEFPTPLVSEADDNILDELDRAARALSPAFMQTAFRASEILKQQPDIPFGRLKAETSPPRATNAP
jgi:hypothetical protein